MDTPDPVDAVRLDAGPTTAGPIDWPAVSVIMPVLDEAEHLAAAVSRVLAQDYPGEVEVVLAIGPSRDGTEEIAARLAADDPRVRAVDNPSGRTPDALNAALTASRHEVVARVDGHGLLTPGYLKTAVEVLRRTGADNVGGVMAAQGRTPFEQAVAAAMTSRLGVGNARWHVGGREGPSESVYLGVFRRDTLERLGGFDTGFTRVQDWELNHRIRSAGGTVWFTPRLQVTYRPRRTIRALASQYVQYGRWRRVTMRRHPGTVSLRYLAAPAALVGVATGAVAGTLVHRTFWSLPAGYALLLSANAAVVRDELSPRARLWLPLVTAVMHLAWGWGFLTSSRRLAASVVPPTSSAEEPAERL